MILIKAVDFRRLIAIITLFCASMIMAQGGDATKGATLFQKNCTSCHKIGGKLIGPDLTGVTKKYDAAWLQKWIINNEALIASGDAKAVEAAKFDPASAMQKFEGILQEQDVKDIITWLENPTPPDTDKDGIADDKDKCPNEAGNTPDGCKQDNLAENGSSIPVKTIVIAFGLLTVLLSFLLYKVFVLINVMKATTGVVEEDEKSKGLAGFFEKNRTLINIGIILFAIISFYKTFSWMLNIDVNKGYAPQQPIYFSHKVHAGENGINCQYCHSSARQSKTSGIPSLNVCMNCHKSINQFTGKLDNKDIDGTKEMEKIYDHIGYDLEKATYTGITKPIEWTRIHNMQDFVYFNHSQHVVAGETAIKKAIKEGNIPGSATANPEKDDSQVCFACHGRVDKMEVVEMANDFTMGWCVECHRSTKVEGLNGGQYYKAHDYDKMHKMAIKAHGDKTQKTVAQIGGLECGKCHY